MRIVWLIALLCIVPVASAEFFEDDCCALSKLSLISSSGSEYSLGCTYAEEQRDRPDHLRDLVLSISSWTDPADTEGAFNIHKGQEYDEHRKWCDGSCIKADDVSSKDEFSLITRQDKPRKARGGGSEFLYNIHREILSGKFLVSIRGHVPIKGEAPDDSTVASIVNSLAECAKSAIDKQDTNPLQKGQVTVLGRPLKHALIDADGVKTTTGADGVFSLGSIPDSVTIDLAYQRESHQYFRFIGDNDDKIRLKIDLKGDTFSQIEIISGGATIKTNGIEQKITDEIKLESFLTQETGTLGLATAYVHFTEALEYYTDVLDVDLSQRTLDIVFFKSGTAMYQYEPGRSWIRIPQKFAAFEDEYRPFVFYHEFSHYVHHMLSGKVFEDYLGPMDINHGGYANDRTSDSYAEGFAAFMPAVIANHYGRYWAGEMDKRASLYPLSGSLETNWQAWERQGRVEEYAIAGILWDLIDGPSEARSDSAGLRVFLRSEMEQMIAGSDMDGDKALSRKEFMFAKIMQGIDKNFNDNLEFYEIEELDDDLAQMLKESKDKDGDGDVPVRDLYDFIEENWELFDSHLKDEFGNDYQNLPERFTADILMSVIDDNPEDDDIDLEFSEIWEVLKAPHKDFTSVYLSLSERFEGIGPVFVRHGFFVEESEGNGEYDVGEPFLDKDNDRKKGLGEAFIDLGLMHHDQGESVGSASNYQRKQRKSFQPLVGEFLRVNRELPFFEIDYVIYGKEYMGIKIPSYAYRLRSSNNDGLIYVPMEKDAVLTIKAEGVETKNPLVFHTCEFEEGYESAISRGYAKEHKFLYSGEPLAFSKGMQPAGDANMFWVGVIALLIIIPSAALFGRLRMGRNN